jgi:AraC family transcriptional regulator
VSCRFEPVWFTNLVGEIDDYAMNALPEDLDIHNGDLHWTMRRIAEEIAQPSFCTDAMIEALATTAGIHLFRHRLSRDAGRQIDDHGGLSPARLRRVREFVESAMEEGPTISAIAEDLGISSSHLRRLFKNATGQTLHDYVDEARIAHAQDLLANTRIPLKVISFKVGFSHASAFSAAFRRATGESPREYRERFEARTYAVQ